MDSRTEVATSLSFVFLVLDAATTGLERTDQLDEAAARVERCASRTSRTVVQSWRP